MRVILFTGKGGVGKTTVAAAYASAVARRGIKTLVLSTDAAHSLGDALGRSLAPDEQVEIEPGLWAQQVDAGARLAQTWGTVQAYLLDLLTSLHVEPLDAADLTALPGADDLVTLLALRHHVQDGPWDLLVVDCAPTAETLRLLALPEALSRLLDRLAPGPASLARAVAPAIGRATGLPLPGRDVLPALHQLRGQLAAARDVVQRPTTSVRLVLTPEAVVLAEARRTLTALSLQDVLVDGVVANRVIPAGLPDGAGPEPREAAVSAWQLGWARAQATVLDDVRAAFAHLPVVVAPYLPQEPVGADALAALGGGLIANGGLDGLLAPPSRPRPVRVERGDGELELVLELGLAHARDVELARQDDDLLVTLAGSRRVVSLPSALRRCDVTGAKVRDGALHVRFAPDPAQWPVPNPWLTQ